MYLFTLSYVTTNHMSFMFLSILVSTVEKMANGRLNFEAITYNKLHTVTN